MLITMKSTSTYRKNVMLQTYYSKNQKYYCNVACYQPLLLIAVENELESRAFSASY